MCITYYVKDYYLLTLGSVLAVLNSAGKKSEIGLFIKLVHSVQCISRRPTVQMLLMLIHN